MNTSSKVISHNDLDKTLRLWRKENHKIVFTNGCFDILHLGHISYLEEAKSLGDKLIIGVNSDDSVKRLKGEHRPINTAFARARLLAALAFVDGVVIFSEDTPYQLILTVMPDILVKGGDYSVDNIVGADIVKNNGGLVKTIALIAGYATTKIIEKTKTVK